MKNLNSAQLMRLYLDFVAYGDSQKNWKDVIPVEDFYMKNKEKYDESKPS